jgi:hypothetical protein
LVQGRRLGPRRACGFLNTIIDGVTKVTEAYPAPFWHFWHCLTLGTSLYTKRAGVVKPMLVDAQR